MWLCCQNNFVELKSDSFKMLIVFQRPAYHGAQDIGSWEAILNKIRYGRRYRVATSVRQANINAGYHTHIRVVARGTRSSI